MKYYYYVRVEFKTSGDICVSAENRAEAREKVDNLIDSIFIMDDFDIIHSHNVGDCKIIDVMEME